jgi:DNA phosphorothioation-dependent restriction protein DptG
MVVGKLQTLAMAAIEALKEFQEELGELDDVGGKLEAAEGRLKVATRAYDEVMRKLESKTALLDRARTDALEKYEEEWFRKTKEMRDLVAKTDVAREAAKAAEIELASLRAQHDQILASLESLRKRFG